MLLVGFTTDLFCYSLPFSPCSFGDFAAVSGTVDASLANILKSEVSDGIIAADYDEEALAILGAKVR